MDDISALLRHLVQTKSIERALAPIATQVCLQNSYCTITLATMKDRW